MVYSHQGDIHVVARANWTCLKDFFWRGKWGGGKKREKAKELSVDRGRDKDREREGERNAVILFIMYSHGERRMG